MRLIFITDTHGKASSPSSRLDDYPSAMLAKMRYVGEYAKSINAKAVIHGGDWLDTPDVSESFVREFAKIVNNYHCPVVGVLGNHDIYGYNPETFLRTSLGVAEGVGVFERLYPDKGLILEDSYFDLDKEGHLEDYTNTPLYHSEGVNTHIHVVHGMLVEREWPHVNCTVIEDIKDCNADIILTGHEHTGFGVKTINNKVFCNPGSLARVTAGTGDIRKDVRMAVIEINKDGYRVELVNLPSFVAKPSSEVLDIDRLLEEKRNKEQLNNFINNINSVEIKNDFNIYESLVSISKIENVEEDVISECRKQLEIAEEELRKGV